jgi:acetyltransferase-like isoleucine patch superfamily enzyme
MIDKSQGISISSLAEVKTKNIGARSRIASFAYIEDGVVVGKDVVIHPHVTIYTGVKLGDGVEIFPGAVIGREPKGAGALARTPNYSRSVEIGSDCSIGPHAVVYYDVTIGNHTLVGDAASIREQCRIGSRTVIGRCVTINYNTVIGDRTKIMDHVWLAGNMHVGNDVFISGGVMTTNDNAIGRVSFDEINIKGPTIEDGAAIGANATLLPGIVIGESALVGSGAVVTKNVVPFTLVMGMPARFVRSLRENDAL